MAKFPKERAKVIAQAQAVSNGMVDNPTVFPNPPLPPASINTDIAAYLAKREEIIAAEANVKKLYDDGDEIFERFEENTKSCIRYAESIAKGDKATLALIGWGLPAPPTKLLPPGQCTAFEIIGQGDGWVRFDWKEPKKGGGKVAAYKVQRSEDGVNFADAATAIESEAALFNQPKGKKLIYQVIAVNRAGEGLPSNTVSLVL